MDELIDCGAALAARLEAPCVISLTGPLGAGKTHFVKGLARGLGSRDEVSSPTFTLVHEYDGGRMPIIHLDFYRLESSADLHALGWQDYLSENCIVAVEWGDRFAECLPESALHVNISIDREGRLIDVRRLA
ncbi:MAG: tRNA (adenosine(37)-N6)-threonylcarbamoyltransferase complex ATPase subunit type 1 TsaE [Chthoniobacterales bacterium]